MCSRLEKVSSSNPRLKSKLAETPKIHIIKPRTRPSRQVPANNCEGINSVPSNNNNKRVGVNKDNMRSNRRQPCRRIFLGPPRCSRTSPSLLPPMFSYKAYGRSSDPNFNNTFSTPAPNPYTELAKEVQLALKRKEENASQLLLPSSDMPPTISKTTPPENDTGRSPRNIDIVITEETPKPKAVNGEPDLPGERLTLVHDDEEDEEVSQDVQANQSCDLVSEQLEMMRTLHTNKMEEISKSVHPRRLLRHLQNTGYFRNNYHNHTRIPTVNNFSIKQQGVKKPNERLFLVLAFH